MRDRSKSLRHEPMARVDCMKCRHFYVTWDERFPRGCRAYGFKTRDLPSAAVWRSSGLNCMKYEKKR